MGEKKTLRNLNQGRSIHITKASNRNVTVILNRLDHDSKVAEHLQNGP